MKITKRQLRTIIKEEKEKLLSEIINRHGIDVKFQKTIDDVKWGYEKELISGKLAGNVREWWKNEKQLEAVLRMLDMMKEDVMRFGK